MSNLNCDLATLIFITKIASTSACLKSIDASDNLANDLLAYDGCVEFAQALPKSLHHLAISEVAIGYHFLQFLSALPKSLHTVDIVGRHNIMAEEIPLIVEAISGSFIYSLNFNKYDYTPEELAPIDDILAQNL